jgi:hypothetical protein
MFKIRAIYVLRVIDVRSRDNCYRWKAKITYSEYVSVALVIQHAKHMRRIDTLRLSGCTVFFNIIL